jgi:hypothetical protein
MQMKGQAHIYFSYLLRLWQEKGDEHPMWRASLESAQTGERLTFATVEELVRFLKQQTTGKSVCDPGLSARLN